MKTPTITTWKLVCILASFALTHSTFSEETEIPLEKVPDAVIKTANAEVPGIKILEAEMEKEDGTVVYELEGEKEEYEYELEITEDGILLELQKEKKSKKD